MPEVDIRLLETAINREPINVARQKGYEVHRLVARDVVDKADYAEGYRFRVSKTIEGKPYPDIFMARSEKEIADFLKRELIVKPPAVEGKGKKIAEQLGLRYDGIQEEIGMQFTDVAETGTTFYANTLEEARTKLAEKRELFAKPPTGELLECMICHQKFDHLTLGTCESCYKKWTRPWGAGGK